MITGHGILLLVGSLVFLIDDDEAEALEGQEDGTAGTEDDIVGILGELFLPYLNTLGIGIFRMVDAQAMAKDTLEPFHHLDSQGNLRQEVEHLLMLVECLLDKMDVDFRLAAGSNAMKQGDRLLEEGKLYLVEGFLLGQAQRFDMFGMGLTAMIQASHFLFVGLKDASLDKGRDGGEGVALVQEFIAGNAQEVVYS